MQISITFRHMEATDAMKELVDEKLSKLKKHIQGNIEAKVVLSEEKYLQSCDISVSSGGQQYNGREETDDMYTSIDRAVEKIERQVDKIKGRKRASRSA